MKIFMNRGSDRRPPVLRRKLSGTNHHRAVEGQCLAIDIPRNAFLDSSSFGPGWKCERGYRSRDGRCKLVAVPKNAHLNYAGSDWAYNRPHRLRQNRCVLP